MLKTYLLCLISILAFLVACSSGQIEKEVIISGIIHNHEEWPDHKEVNFHVYNVGLADQITFPAKIQDNGSFQVRFPLNFPQDILMAHSITYVAFVHPGDSLFVTFDARDTSFPSALTRMEFMGDGALESTQLNKYFASKFKSRAHMMDRHNAVRELSPETYRLFRDSLQDEYQKHRDTFIKNERPTDEIIRWTQYQDEFEYYVDLLQYPALHRSANNLRGSEWDYGDNYYDFVKDLPKIEKQILINSFASFIFPNSYQTYVRELELKKVDYNFSATVNRPDSLTFFGIINRARSNDLLTQMTLSSYMNQLLKAHKVEVYDRYADLAFQYIREPFLRDPLRKHYLEVKDAFLPDEEIEDTFIKNLNHGESISYLDTILEKYTGKILFIDFWATWCLPCIEELPKAESIRKQYEDFNIEFVHICMDSEKDKWSSLIAKLGLDGEHYWLTKEQGNLLKESLKIRGAPLYILADEKGNIHGHGFDFRLSNQKTREQIDKLLM